MASVAAKRKAEEQNLKALRELTALPHNKKCQECQERGTTYADMTTSGFVCTSCSGYLRGLNPPHRVKSISMTTFLEKEIQQLRKGGNEAARATWLAKWDPKRDREPRKSEEVAFKEFLIAKYERRQWYQPPAEVKKAEEKDPSKSEPRLQPPPSKGHTDRPRFSSQLSPQTTPTHSTQAAFTPSTPPTSTTAPSGQAGGGAKVDLLTSDPFAPKPVTKPPVGGVSVLPPGPLPTLRPAASKSDEFGAFAGAPASGLIQPPSSSLSSTQSLLTSSVPSTSISDRYAALANLDQSLKDVRIKEEERKQHEQAIQAVQQAQAAHAAQQSQMQAFGAFQGSVNPFGAPAGSMGMGGPQPQSNPFLAGVPGQPVTGMQQVPGTGFGNQMGGGFGAFQGAGGGFPGQMAPARPFGGQMGMQQMNRQMGGQMGQFGAFQQQPPQLWGQQGFGVRAQGPQTQWRPQQGVPQQQQWGQVAPQQQFGGQQGVGMQMQRGFGGQQPSGGGFGGIGMQQAPTQQQQFGSFVSATQQQQKPGGQFNWGSSPTTPPGQQRGLPTSSSANTQPGTGWSGGLSKPVPGSTWGMQQQPQSVAINTSTGWGSGVLSPPAVQSTGGGGWGGGGGFGAFGQMQTSMGGFNQPGSSPQSWGGGGGGMFGQPAAQTGGFGGQLQAQSGQSWGGGGGGGQFGQQGSSNPFANTGSSSSSQTNPFL